MNRILLVEDEQIVRLALKSLIEWDNYDIDIHYEATNGKEALEIVKMDPDIDIILTDINMPIMDGIELIKHVKELSTQPAIVVLSAYDDYDLVRNAFKLGVQDYILKPQMEPDQILQLFLKILNSNNKDKIKEEKELLEKGYKNKILKALIDGKAQVVDKQSLDDTYINIGSKNILVCFLWIDQYKEVEKRYAENTLQHFINGIYNSIKQVLSDYKTGEILCLSPEEYVLILSNETSSEKRVRDWIRAIIEKTRLALNNYMNIKVTIGISSLMNDYENIHLLYKEAKQNAGYRYIFGKGRNIYPEDIENIKFISKVSVIGNEQSLLEAFRILDKEKINQELNKLLLEIGSFRADRIEDTFQYYLELIFIIIQYLGQANQEITGVFNHNTDFYKIISQFETQKEIHEWINTLVFNITDFLMNHSHENKSKIIHMSQKYIHQNYMRKITLYDVSEYVNLSEGYLSKLFTKEINVTFTEYLTEVRMEKAKEALKNPYKKIYQVSEEVGYESVEHFSRVFKKYTGISPKKYQKRVN